MKEYFVQISLRIFKKISIMSSNCSLWHCPPIPYKLTKNRAQTFSKIAAKNSKTAEIWNSTPFNLTALFQTRKNIAEIKSNVKKSLTRSRVNKQYGNRTAKQMFLSSRFCRRDIDSIVVGSCTKAEQRTSRYTARNHNALSLCCACVLFIAGERMNSETRGTRRARKRCFVIGKSL